MGFIFTFFQFSITFYIVSVIRRGQVKIYADSETFLMDKIDSRILQELQDDFPLCEKPYEVIAERLRIPVEELWDRIQRMIDKGVIRRMGASFDSGKFGFRSTLAAVSVKPEDVDRAAGIIGRFSEVTHSYLRKDEFNIWFTIIAADDKRIAAILEQIRESLSLESSQVLNLPAKRIFKLDARFQIP
jgi:DNA-binding Lrp family transcriptional regulator